MDNDILEQIYHRYAGQVYLYLFSLCHSHALAEDLMQETFLKALCSMELSQDKLSNTQGAEQTSLSGDTGA